MYRSRSGLISSMRSPGLNWNTQTTCVHIGTKTAADWKHISMQNVVVVADPLRLRLWLKVRNGLLDVTMVIKLLFALQLCWIAPTQNVDNTPVDELTVNNIYIGTQSGVYDYRSYSIPTLGPGMRQCSNFKLAPGQYYIVATQVDIDGEESAASNEVVKTETRGLTSPDNGTILESPTGGRLIRDE